VKPNASRTLRLIHLRALRVALEAAGGDARQAAKALGMTTDEMLELIESEPGALWTATPTTGISGTRRKLDAPIVDEQNEIGGEPEGRRR
jgi:hypothetical protein